ncbi:alsin homolog [Anopheles marshallii]|uniref:alsin homolog n=1 Tax=Anopheles marshallii TaxID=1521116 RepID=UPI00237B2D40|nr:alsin homolog [Anopheles marshallii]
MSSRNQEAPKNKNTMAATDLVSIYCDLSEESKLSILLPEGYEPSYGVKLRVLGETHILLDANGVLLQGVHRATDKTIEFRCLERNVTDFDTEGNWIFCIKSDSSTVHRSRNGSLEEWTHLFPDREGFVRVCCNNNGILLLAGDGRLFVQGDFGTVFNCDQLTQVHEVKQDNVQELAAGIDFAIVSLQRRTKVYSSIKKDILFDQCTFDEKNFAIYGDWQNIFEHFNIHPYRRRESYEVSATLEELSIYGQMLHQTGVASFGKVNKGQLGTGDHIRRDKIHQLNVCNVSKIASGCDYSSALTVDGQLFFWGDMNKNQAISWKLENAGNTSTPTVCTRFKHVLDVCCGNFQTFVLTNDLKLYDVKSSSDDAWLSYKIATPEMHQGSKINEHIPFMLASDSLLVVNHLPVRQDVLKLYNKEQTTLQSLLKHIKEMNSKNGAKQRGLSQGAGTDSSSLLSPKYFHRLCTTLFYLLLLRMQSFRTFLIHQDVSRLVSIVLHDEIYLLYRRMLQCFCDNECLNLMRSCDQELLQIYLDNVQVQIDLAELLITSDPGKALDEPTESALLTMKSEWLRFLNEEVSEKMGNRTKQTKEFWQREENVKWLTLKEPHRRMILDSNDVPLKLLDVNIFSSSPRFVLFNDVFCYLSGLQVVQYPLKLAWITTEVSEMQRSRYKEKHRFMITIVTPEETLRCHTLNVDDKTRWLRVLKAQVLQCLDKQTHDKQPLYRYSKYTYSDRYERHAGSRYEGMWLIGQMDGIGSLASTDRSYSGEFYHGNITGYGCMNRSVFGISTIYEGDFVNGKYDGYGFLKTTSNRSTHYFRYQGYFKADKYNGFGTLTTSAYQYNGDFVNDQKEGFGVIEDSLNGVKYIGMFMGDKKHGNGILVTTNGTYYAGFFANDILTHSAGGLAIFPSGIYYKGELTIDGPFGKGMFYYPEREIDSEQFELDDSNTKMAGHTMTGIFGGTWTGVRISNATMAMVQTFNKVPMLDLKINAERKWSSIFSCFHETLFGTSDIVAIRRMDIRKVWNRVAIFVSRAKRKEHLKANNFAVVSSSELDDRAAALICQSGYQLQSASTVSLRSSLSDSRLSLHNGFPSSPAAPSPSTVAPDAISVQSFSSVASRGDEDEFMLIPTGYGGRTRNSSPFRDLDFIPNFCITSVDREGLEQLRNYITDAFQSVYHPLHGLFEKLSNCFYSTYSCWKYTPHSILCEPAMNEWISIVSRIYTLVLTVMFPALPKDSIMIEDELVSYQSLLYPILMTQGIYSALFVLYASKCSKNDEIYRQRILICMKKTDENLVQLLDINRELVPIIKHEKYQQAIESLNRFREKCCPSEMIKHINEAFTLVDQACKEQEVRMDVAADNLLELIIWLIIKANLPQLGAEISLLEDLMQNDYGISYRNTQNDYCLITLKASYQHIISNNFFVNKTFDPTVTGT